MQACMYLAVLPVLLYMYINVHVPQGAITYRELL